MTSRSARRSLLYSARIISNRRSSFIHLSSLSNHGPAMGLIVGSCSRSFNQGRFSNNSLAVRRESNPLVRVPLSDEQQQFLDRALRVNQAGELAAVLIYDAQTPPIVRSNPQLKELMKHMYDQEAGHFKIFNGLMAKHRIRPTLMYPVWRVAATALGWSTAIMGREAAMACTEAVETEIGDHYNNQVRVLLAWAREVEESGGIVSEEMKELLTTLRKIRDEELEHLDHAVENDSKAARPYEALTSVIRGGCRAAIWISERV